MRAGSGRNSARATASPMSIVPKEVNITIVTLSSTLDDIFGIDSCVNDESTGRIHTQSYNEGGI